MTENDRLTDRSKPMLGYMSNGHELKDYLEKLAAYEDTGLEPEEVGALKTDVAVIKESVEYMAKKAVCVLGRIK